jgi:hypothetical protein
MTTVKTVLESEARVREVHCRENGGATRCGLYAGPSSDVPWMGPVEFHAEPELLGGQPIPRCKACLGADGAPALRLTNALKAEILKILDGEFTVGKAAAVEQLAGRAKELLQAIHGWGKR